MPGRLSGKTAIVTGAGAGFGAGIAAKFVAEGANVLVWDIDPRTPAQVAAALDATSKQTHPFVGDVSEPADWERALREVRAKWGGLDVLVNNAGVVYASTPSIEVGPGAGAGYGGLWLTGMLAGPGGNARSLVAHQCQAHLLLG